METKLCSKCKLEKPVSEFYRKGKGYQCWCKTCLNLALHRKPKEDNGSFATSLKCDICGAKLEKYTKATHFHKYHPEYKFTTASINSTTKYQCSACGKMLTSFGHLVLHYQSYHKDVIQKPPESMQAPIQTLDNFFNQITDATTEIKSLRHEMAELEDGNNYLLEAIISITQERDNWESKARVWLGKLVELQNVLAKGEEF